MKNLAEFLLQNFPSAQYASGKNEILMKCPFCGDSKDPKTKHFYVSIVEGKPHFYNCFKCGEKGILNSKVLRKLSIYDIETLNELDKYNSNISKNQAKQGNIYNANTVYRITNYIQDSPLTQAKIKYINYRLGTNLNIDDCIRLKIVPNLYDLLNYNNIKYLTRDPNIVQELSDSFIGFLSVDNGSVNLRNLREGKVNHYIDHKYIEYNIFGKPNKRNYVIPTMINTTYTDTIKIHLAEGVFDILSIFFNVNNCNTNQSIYSSIGGKTYTEAMGFFISNYGLINSEFHIYIDNDINRYTINGIRQFSDNFKIKTIIHYNKYNGEKDFGVPANRILDCILI